VGVGVGMRWMQLAAQFFHEDPDRAAYVRNRGVEEAKHEGYIITATPLERVADQAPARSGFAVMRRAEEPIPLSMVVESSLESGEPPEVGA
jgi:hypothetical protein